MNAADIMDLAGTGLLILAIGILIVLILKSSRITRQYRDNWATANQQILDLQDELHMMSETVKILEADMDGWAKDDDQQGG